MAWAIKTGWRYEAVELVKETDKTVTYVGYGGPPTRLDKSKLLPWRGSEEGARAIAAKLTSAVAEYERRKNAARVWFNKRQAEIVAALNDTDLSDKER